MHKGRPVWTHSVWLSFGPPNAYCEGTYDFEKNKLQKLEDALVEQLQTAAEKFFGLDTLNRLDGLSRLVGLDRLDRLDRLDGLDGLDRLDSVHRAKV